MNVNNGYGILPLSTQNIKKQQVAFGRTSFIKPVQTQNTAQIPGYAPVNVQAAKVYNQQKSILDNFSKGTFARFRTNAVGQSQHVQTVTWKNDLKSLFLNNKAVIYAMVPRTFNAKDTNGDELISANEQKGTFLNAIERLDEMKHYGINTFHLLPIHEPGKQKALGTAGSIYAPKDFLAIDPMLDDPNDPRSVKEELKEFTAECHKRGIRVMVDLPSCASVDLYNKRKHDLMAVDANGNPEVPQGWNDIRMFDPWSDEDNRVLNKALVDYHKKYVDMCLDCGIDGIRADVARAKPVEFWDEIIPYARGKDPEFGFLAESYTYEDASPMLNMPYDRPEELLASGFDSYYGQFHIFHEWNTAEQFHDYMREVLEMSQRLPEGKSLIGSFATHDDDSPMSHGGVEYCNLTTGIQATLPMTNPYFLTGFESGDRFLYPYREQEAPAGVSQTDSHEYAAHFQKLDIFNMSRKPEGKNPEIGEYMSKMMGVRKQHEDVLTKGSYIPLKVKGNNDDKIIAYARHLNGKTILVIANKEVNAREQGKVVIPGLNGSQILTDLSPSYGQPSKYSAQDGAVEVNLGPARFHMFEINTPNIEHQVKEVLKQKI